MHAYRLRTPVGRAPFTRLSDNSANATGVAVVSTVLLSAIPAAFPRGFTAIPPDQVAGFTNAFRIAVAVTIGFILLAAALSTRIHDSDAEATIRRP